MPRYALDERFVNLTLLIDNGEKDTDRRQESENQRFSNLADVIAKVENRALVVLGNPGSGKSTLLRRLQLDHSIECLRNETQEISLFIPLNTYRARVDGTLPQPRDWLSE